MNANVFPRSSRIVDKANGLFFFPFFFFLFSFACHQCRFNVLRKQFFSYSEGKTAKTIVGTKGTALSGNREFFLLPTKEE